MAMTDKVGITDRVGITEHIGAKPDNVGITYAIGFSDSIKEFQNLPGYSGSYARDHRLPHQVRFDRTKDCKTILNDEVGTTATPKTTADDDTFSREIRMIDVTDRSSSESNDQEPIYPRDANSRYSAWSRIEKCPKCKGSEQSVFKYYDMSTDRYVVRCINVPRYVLNELDAYCSGKQYKPPARTKNAGQIPLSHQVHSIAEYIDKVQPMLCSYHVSF